MKSATSEESQTDGNQVKKAPIVTNSSTEQAQEPDGVSAGQARWTGKGLHGVWANACLWSSIGFERDWEMMHPHRKEKWNELAKAVNPK